MYVVLESCDPRFLFLGRAKNGTYMDNEDAQKLSSKADTAVEAMAMTTGQVEAPKRTTMHGTRLHARA